MQQSDIPGSHGGEGRPEQALRAEGLEISTGELIDAAGVCTDGPLRSPQGLRFGLAAVLVKHRRFRSLFDRLFPLFFPDSSAGLLDSDGGLLSDEELSLAARTVVESGDEVLAAYVARQAVARFVRFQPGRAVAGVQYEFQAADGLRLDELETETEAASDGDSYDRRRRSGMVADNAEAIRRQITAEVRRLLVADRGADAVARTLRQPLAEDVVIAQASAAQLAAIRDVMTPFAHRLMASLSRKAVTRSRQVHLGRTVRRSLATGGVPLELALRAPRKRKPELWVVADMSGSVAAFGAFAVALVSNLSSLFRRVRCFAFIENLNDVTAVFERHQDPLAAAREINAMADLTWSDGHSDYGRALRQLHQGHLTQLSRRTSVLVLGDARSNYRPAEGWALSALSGRAGHVYWLNPEPAHLWDTGDSVMSAYLPSVEKAVECRTVAQLGHFIDGLPPL
jgi:uncharacterized protein with von Willebrand factor type A (vWA) domain